MSGEKHTKEDLEKLLAEIETLKTEVTGYSEQESYSRATLSEYGLARDGLSTLGKAKKGRETLVPLGGMIMIKAKVDPKDKVIVGLGHGVSVEKDKKDALAWVEERISELENSHSQIVTRIGEMERRMAELNQRAQAIYLEIQDQFGEGQN